MNRSLKPFSLDCLQQFLYFHALSLSMKRSLKPYFLECPQQFLYFHALSLSMNRSLKPLFKNSQSYSCTSISFRFSCLENPFNWPSKSLQNPSRSLKDPFNKYLNNVQQADLIFCVSRRRHIENQQKRTTYVHKPMRYLRRFFFVA